MVATSPAVPEMPGRAQLQEDFAVWSGVAPSMPQLSPRRRGAGDRHWPFGGSGLVPWRAVLEAELGVDLRTVGASGGKAARQRSLLWPKPAGKPGPPHLAPRSLQLVLQFARCQCLQGVGLVSSRRRAAAGCGPRRTPAGSGPGSSCRAPARGEVHAEPLGLREGLFLGLECAGQLLWRTGAGAGPQKREHRGESPRHREHRFAWPRPCVAPVHGGRTHL